jgi:hypothetical protein
MEQNNISNGRKIIFLRRLCGFFFAPLGEPAFSTDAA